MKLSSSHQPLVSVVLLSYNRPEYLRESLESLLHQSYVNLQITVVDNPSRASAEVSRIVRRHRRVKLIQNPANLGYTGGMNRGLAEATGHYVFLTEDDIVLKSDCIERLVQCLEAEAAVELVAPIIYNKKEQTIRCAGGEFALGAIYRMKIHGAGEPDTGQFSEPFDVGYIDGAAMFARKDFWQRFEGFRDEYFMYVEAVELCARVGRSGKRMMVVPAAKVYHFEPTERATPPEIEFHKVKNFFSLYLLHAPARHLPEFVCRYAVLNTARTLLGRTESQPRAFLKALLWVAGKTPSLLKERYRKRGSAN